VTPSRIHGRAVGLLHGGLRRRTPPAPTIGALAPEAEILFPTPSLVQAECRADDRERNIQTPNAHGPGLDPWLEVSVPGAAGAPRAHAMMASRRKGVPLKKGQPAGGSSEPEAQAQGPGRHRHARSPASPTRSRRRGVSYDQSPTEQQRERS
jgi:hypothetical protein